MHIAFHKMEGVGNDFIVIDGRHRSPRENGLDRFDADLVGRAVLRRLADRRRGIGCDQLLVVESPRHADTDAYYRVFNADGTEAQQCGNGVRCIAALMLEGGVQEQSGELVLESPGGRVRARRAVAGGIAVQMTDPDFAPSSLPFDAPATADEYVLDIAGEPVRIGAVSMGNPHAVVTVASVAQAPVDRLGPAIAGHARFPEGVNAGFMQIVDRGCIKLRVFERGVGETAACGTGACAAVALARDHGKVGDEVRVELPGGQLVVSWGGQGTRLWMSGPARHVFEGRITL